MSRIVFNFFLVIASIIVVHANGRSFADSSTRAYQGKNLRVSLVTCGVGNETWQTFGHCAIRIIDSTRDSLHTDLTYNYGIYDPFEGTVEKQFLKGRIRVSLEVARFNRFIKGYAEEGRSVEEMVLILSEDQKEKMQAFLENNALIENKYYTYHFFFDNCTIRIRDVFPKTLGSGFVFGPTIPENIHMVFNEGYNLYFEHKYWYKILANVFFGRKINLPMSSYQIMFLPDFLEKGVEGATYDGKKVCGNKEIILKGNVPDLSPIDAPFIITLLLAILTIIGLSFARLSLVGKIVTYIVLFLSGLIGFGILYAWFCTEYDLSADNFNLLWALPTNILLPFLPGRIQGKYGLVAMFLILLCFIVDLTRLQTMLLFELVPLWLALFFIYGYLYRRSINS